MGTFTLRRTAYELAFQNWTLDVKRRAAATRAHTLRRTVDHMIQLKGLTKRYGTFTAVDAIDLDVPHGQLFGFLGPNGAGKTTTLRMIAGILRPTAGTVHINGIDVAENPIAAKAVLGYIPDRPFIYEKLTGAEFLRFVAGLYGQDGPGDRAAHDGAAHAVRSARVARRARRELQPRHAAEADHLERVSAQARR